MRIPPVYGMPLSGKKASSVLKPTHRAAARAYLHGADLNEMSKSFHAAYMEDGNPAWVWVAIISFAGHGVALPDWIINYLTTCSAMLLGEIDLAMEAFGMRVRSLDGMQVIHDPKSMKEARQAARRGWEAQVLAALGFIALAYPKPAKHRNKNPLKEFAAVLRQTVVADEIDEFVAAGKSLNAARAAAAERAGRGARTIKRNSPQRGRGAKR